MPAYHLIQKDIHNRHETEPWAKRGTLIRVREADGPVWQRDIDIGHGRTGKFQDIEMEREKWIRKPIALKHQ